jgi:hypothetical protein
VPAEAKPLFRPEALRPKLTGFALPPRVGPVLPKLRRWAEMVTTGEADGYNETELLPDFLTDVFLNTLGYTRPADAPRYTFSRERHVEVDGKVADAVLGDLGADRTQYLAVIEGKGARDPLDRPFAGRRLSAVEQGYKYATNLPCDWILLTNLRQLRLYSKTLDQYTYERFDLPALARDEGLLRKFVFLLGAERMLPPAGRCHLYDLLAESERIGAELTREYYADYAKMRRQAFDQLCAANASVEPADLLAATQKLLDRVLFCAFCEARGLLPAQTIARAYRHSDPYNPRPIWENFKGLFRSIDLGNALLQIPRYNGGLFEADPLLDRLVVPDPVCEVFARLAAYDYRPARQAGEQLSESASGKLIDVDILGHIFEQSISELERLRNHLEGREPGEPEGRTRRKKEGAFYTPAFITRYIVGQALGGVLADRFETLRARHQQEASPSVRSVLADPKVYDLALLKKAGREALVRLWEAWQEELKKIRIVDPACGSGAFLIEAFDQLHAALDAANGRLEELRGQRELFDLDEQLLKNNLYGVDLNREAVEICRLSLWIKTAHYDKVLTSLDHTIRMGNSIVADPAVHPRAFDWQAAFPEVFAAGGFDVVIGNPPYIRQEWLAPYKAYWEKTFKSYHGTADIFAYFYELGIRLLREGGRLGYITSGSWVRSSFGAPLREFFAANAAIESMVDFGEFQPFEDAEMIRPTIAIIHKRGPGGPMRLFKWLTKGHPPDNLGEVIAASPTIDTCRLGRDAWELESDDVLALRQKLGERGRTLAEYAGGRIYRGILTGLTDVFVIDATRREELIREDPRSGEVIKPFAQGTHLRPWYMEASGQYLLALKSSANFSWPWSNRGDEAEAVFQRTYPAIHSYLNQFRESAVKRQDQGRFWWELRACAYWDMFDQDKIVWPDISKLPRFSMDACSRYLGNTVYSIPGADYFLLGVLSSWATWFFISKTAQPLRLRGDRWQYRLFTQFMERLPVPRAHATDQEIIERLARECCLLGLERYEVQAKVQRRLRQTFGEGPHGQPRASLNSKAEAWWELTLKQLGAALKGSFDLPSNPFINPHRADEWEPYLARHRRELEPLSRRLTDAEAELNDRVYRLFDLSRAEIGLLQRQVAH